LTANDKQKHPFLTPVGATKVSRDCSQA